MSYSVFQALVSGKWPVWLYRIVLGTEEVFYTSSGEDYEQTKHDFFDKVDFFGGDQDDFFTLVWHSKPISRGPIRTTSAIGRAEVSMVVPQSDAFVRKFLSENGYNENTVRIFHGYRNDTDEDLVLKFYGRVVETAPLYSQITLKAENRFTAFRNKALNAVLQRPCRHALYHGGCGLTLADWELDGTATDWTKPELTVTEAANKADGYYSGGIVTYNGVSQFVLKHTGSTLKLLDVLPDLADAIDAASGVGVAVKIAPGCDRTMNTCESKFDNLDNHGGFPWMTDTPFDGRNPF